MHKFIKRELVFLAGSIAAIKQPMPRPPGQPFGLARFTGSFS